MAIGSQSELSIRSGLTAMKVSPYQHNDTAKHLAEFVGTYFLVFTIGCNVHTGSIGAAISIGAILMVMVYSLGPVSGGHLNPAVTLAIGLSGREKITFENMGMYMLAQIAGGICGALNYWIIFNDAFVLQPRQGYSTRTAAWSEILFTMALCYVVLNVATTENKAQGNVKPGRLPNNFYGLAIGLTVTSSAIAVGPVSGCSLNPAVSIASMVASGLSRGGIHMSIVALYILAPLFGSCLATLFFYFVQGGLSGQFEYGIDSERPTPRLTAPVYMEPEHKERQHCELLKMGGDYIILTKAEESHMIFMGLSWKVSAKIASTDIDASCVKFSSDGRMIDGIYFNNHEGKERKQGESILFHQGDNLTGKGVGFGFIENPERHLRHGQPPEIKDDERIEIRSLAELKKCQRRCTYMFFVVNVFSADCAFSGIEEMTIRIVDQDNQGHEMCRFQKGSLQGGGITGNAFVLGVLRWHQDWEKWVFQVIDEQLDIRAHGTYRDFEPKLREMVLKMEGKIAQ